jgi:translation initiation factor IF-2
VIESHLDTSHGPLATVVVNTGTLKAGDPFVCGVVAGKVRAMIDGVGQRVTEAGPSCPVRLSGFEGVPQVGDILQVMGSDREARDVASAIQERAGAVQKRSFVDLVSRLHEGRLTQLKIVLKADAQGSLEAIQSSLEQQATDKVSVKVIHAAVGAVTENDVMMAAASEGIVIAFHVDVPLVVRRTAEREGVQIREHLIIYALFEEVAGLLAGLLEPEEREEILGHLEVKGVFLSKKSEQIIGGRVLDGVIKRVQFRLQRRGEVVGTGRISSLRKVDKDVKEVKEGGECGMRVEATVPVEVGDVLEGYVRELKKRE